MTDDLLGLIGRNAALRLGETAAFTTKVCRNDLFAEVILKSGAGVFDGDEFGNGECGLFMYGPNADRLFNVVEPLLRGWKPLEGGYAIKRYGTPAGQSERIEF